ncbi:glutathione S-transferase family protein [Sphingomonas sp. So64.6b]|uniref:glutathione S-transferase family protein n=1 Tax=Sphingomonas sp. So64.6b TaxID=2997354 RepID=UPI0015FFB064|nr:glutathione S-transferase family protein [Sphingomonas sp. So64.6b]QNA86241.1 glutathione S-transferase family protein [Sphingomonas sp. So64.6b]
MLALYHAPRSRSGRTVWLLEELGAAYDIRFVDIVYGDGSGRRDPANVHPDGKVPALVDGDALVTESLAVALYLTDLLPEAGLGVLVGDPARGTYLTWLAWCAGELEPTIFAQMTGAGDDPRAKAGFDAVVARIDAALAAGPYLMGDRFTAVDVMVGGTLAWARSVMPPSAALDAYLARLNERPASIAACAKDAPAADRQAA